MIICFQNNELKKPVTNVQTVFLLPLLICYSSLISRQLQEAKEKYQNTESEVKNLKKFIKLLHTMMEQRYKTYTQFKRWVSYYVLIVL